MFDWIPHWAHGSIHTEYDMASDAWDDALRESDVAAVYICLDPIIRALNADSSPFILRPDKLYICCIRLNSNVREHLPVHRTPNAGGHK